MIISVIPSVPVSNSQKVLISVPFFERNETDRSGFNPFKSREKSDSAISKFEKIIFKNKSLMPPSAKCDGFDHLEGKCKSMLKLLLIRR